MISERKRPPDLESVRIGHNVQPHLTVTQRLVEHLMNDSKQGEVSVARCGAMQTGGVESCFDLVSE